MNDVVNESTAERRFQMNLVLLFAIVAVLLAAIEPPTGSRHSDRLAGNAPRDGPPLDPGTLRGPPLVL